MSPIFPEESPIPDWRQDREPLPEAVVAGVPPALWLIPQPTRLPLQTRATVDRPFRRAMLMLTGPASPTLFNIEQGTARSTLCYGRRYQTRAAATGNGYRIGRLYPVGNQACSCQKSCNATLSPRNIFRSALRMLATLFGYMLRGRSHLPSPQYCQRCH